MNIKSIKTYCARALSISSRNSHLSLTVSVHYLCNVVQVCYSESLYKMASKNHPGSQATNASDGTSTRRRTPHSSQKLLTPSTSTSIKIRESSPNGTHQATYLINSSSITVQRPQLRTLTSSPTESSTSASATLLLRLLTPFLPTNYPHSVTPDYTPYQVYDSVQAFASTIAGLLASRAVLTSLGLGSEDSTSTATAATLLSIAQNSIGQFATIFFAHYFAVRIEAEVKFYRFLADIVNDAALVIDVLSPSLTTYARVPALCIASACRAICGVCGGSSKAILSAHFARAGNIGELNAKDGSQETIVSLVGMWVGGFVVTRVEGERATLVWMLVLLGVHLWANWMAVRSVRMRTLNRGRAGIALGMLSEGRKDIGIDKVGERERLFDRGGAMRLHGAVMGFCEFGGIQDLLHCIRGSKQSDEESAIVLACLSEIFADEEYILWLDRQHHRCTIVLKERSRIETQLAAWCHAFRVVGEQSRLGNSTEATLEALEETLEGNSRIWSEWSSQLQAAGWDLGASNLAVLSSNRIQLDFDD